jgi:ubiquinone/menaquinone biosynthesis C-methylase UbiE
MKGNNAMAMNGLTEANPYALATGAAAVRRLHMLHDIYSLVGRRVLLQAGLEQGMSVADFGCGVGVMTRMLAEIVGPAGWVTGVDVDPGQLAEARAWCDQAGLKNTRFVRSDATRTPLSRESYDLVYCRFLLLHLPDPMACLREMRDVLKPGGIIVVEDGDLTSATSVPPSAMNAFADLFGRFGTLRGLNYSLERNLYHMLVRAGFSAVHVRIHQPAIARGPNRLFLKWSVEEGGPGFVEAGIIAPDQLQRTLAKMQDVVEDPDVLILAPRMSLVWGRKWEDTAPPSAMVS